MSVSQYLRDLYLKFSVGRVFECPDFEFELDFDQRTPHSNFGQNPGSAVRRRLSTDHSFVLNASESLMVNNGHWAVDSRACQATRMVDCAQGPFIFFNHKGVKTNLHRNHICSLFQEYMNGWRFHLSRFLMSIDSDMCHVSYICHQDRQVYHQGSKGLHRRAFSHNVCHGILACTSIYKCDRWSHK